MKIFLPLLVFLSFTLVTFAQAPIISSFTPASGPVGTSVTITGKNFSPVPASNIVFFGPVRAMVTSASANSLTVTVPPGSSYQPITVTTKALTAFSASPFIVTFAGANVGFSASSFAPKNDYATGKGPACIAAGDFDGDGKSDLVAVNDTANTVSVFRNLSAGGNISFAAKTDYSTGIQPYSVAVGDLDGDGKLDLAIANGAGNSVSILRNTSSGAGNISFAAKIDLVSGTYPFCVLIQDFDGDGKPDLAAGNINSGTISIFKNNSTAGNFSFSEKSDFASGQYPNWLAAGDLDNDGKPDLASANSAPTASVSVLRNTSTPGTISFAAKTDFNGLPNATAIAMGDLDGDGKTDLAVAGGNSSLVSVLLNSSTGSGNISFLSPRQPFSIGGSSFGITLGDADGDGIPDITAANTSVNSISILKNRSTVGFTSFDQRIDFSVGSNPWVAVLADFDGDGKPDIATANQRSANISVLKNAVSALSIQSFSPASAGTGAIVTITGSGFSGVTGVSFGGIPADSFAVNSPGIISAVVGAGTSGNVTITANNAAASLAGFTYLPTPVITSFFPATAGAGDTIIITGTNLSEVTTVNFGGAPVSRFTANSPTKITAVIDTTSATGVVSVTSAGGTSMRSGFTYNNTPGISSFSPDSAALGAVVSIQGKHFITTRSVTFGNMNAASFTIVSPNTITAIVAAGSSGNVDVQNISGSSSIGGFAFIPPPSLNSFTPTTVGASGAIVISGTNFYHVLSVTFGDVPASSFIVHSPTSITAIVAGGSSGNVKVITTGGEISLAGFHYISAPVPVINSIAPISGPVGTVVTITGLNFSPVPSANTVYFGAVRAIVSSANTNSLHVIVPKGATYQAVTLSVHDLTAYSSQFFTITFNGGHGVFNTNSFDKKLDFKVGDRPVEASISDLDGDGKPDLVVANYVSETISVLKNASPAGNIFFEEKVDYPVPGKPGGSISIGDLDGDGKPDIAVTLESSMVSVFRNTSANGVISFAERIDFATGNTPAGISAGDIDGDGKPDLVVTNLHSNTVSVFRNRGARGIILFDPRVDYATGVSPYYVCIHDFDGDKKPDLAIANYFSQSVSVLKNNTVNGVISFESKIDFPVGIQPFKLAIGDINGDGKIDIASCNNNSSSLSILRNTGTAGSISFASGTDFATDLSPNGVSITDLDGDGKPDLASGNFSYNTVSILQNTGTDSVVTFSQKTDITPGNAPYSIVSGDLDGDGKPDLVTPNFGDNTISVFRNKIGEINAKQMCPPQSSSFIFSNMTGTSYQWQIDTGTGFKNINNNSNYSGTGQIALVLNNIPSSWYGYRYRCVVDNTTSDVFELKFSDSWMGSVNSAWENVANWSCGSIPDSNTDVVINSGTIIINSNVTVRSLTINPGASITINTGYKLTILH